MIEPTTAVSLITIALSLIQSGQKAANDPDWSTVDDTKALVTLFKSIKELIGINKKLKDDKLDPIDRLAAIHTMIITRAFHDALKDHLSLTQNKSGHRKLNKYIQNQLVEHEKKPTPCTILSLHTWLSRPTFSTIYQTLWSICSNAKQFGLDEDLLIQIDEDGQPGKSKQLFELAFYKHYAKYTDGALGKELKQLQDLPKDWQKRFYRHLLLVNAMDFPNQSMFPNDATGPTLGQMYVQPDIKIDKNETMPPAPAISSLEKNCSGQKVSLVTADFGFGKSLTSRMFAAHLATQAVTGERPTESYPIPVRIICQHHMRSEVLNFATLQEAFKTACMEQISSLKKLSKTSDLLPDLKDATFHLIIDGLDEIVVHSKACERFFEDLYEHCNDSLLITVFSRPGVIAQKVFDMTDHNQLLHFKINRFNEEKTNAWLEKWNQFNNTQIPTDDFRKVLEEGLQNIPIMLFMTATVWDEVKTKDGNYITRAKLYERFVYAMARGKASKKTGEHGAIITASQKLLEVIEEKLPQEQPTEVDAMLWLMGRIAWKRFCLKANKNRELKLIHIQTILEEELDIDDQDLDIIKQGVCVATQTNMANNDQHIFFQHESFAEFFIAQFWINSLKFIFKLDPYCHKRKEILSILSEANFYDGELAQQEFLLELGLVDDCHKNEFLDKCKSFIKTEPLSNNIKAFEEDKITPLKKVLLQIVIVNNVHLKNHSPFEDNLDPNRTVDFIISKFRRVLYKNYLAKDIIYLHLSTTGLIFKDSEFSEVIFKESFLTSINFISCTFEETTFSRCYLSGITFFGCTFLNVSWSHSLMFNCQFFDCVFDHSQIKSSMIQFTNFHFSTLENIQIDESLVINSKIIDCAVSEEVEKIFSTRNAETS